MRLPRLTRAAHPGGGYEDAPIPKPSTGDALVRIHATGLAISFVQQIPCARRLQSIVYFFTALGFSSMPFPGRSGSGFQYPSSGCGGSISHFVIGCHSMSSISTTIRLGVAMAG